MKTMIRVWACASAFFLWNGAQARSLEIYWVDVEGGGATLLISPAGESLLIDAGEAVARDAKRIHEVATRVAGVKQIDHMVTTHWHSDHFGGVYGLSQLMPIHHFYANRPLPETLADIQGTPFALMRSQYLKLVAKGPVILRPGDTVPMRQTTGQPALTVKCIAANQEILKGHGTRNPVCSKVQEAPLDASENLNSLVLLVQFGKFNFFDSGDLTRNMETKLVCPTNIVGKVVLYQSGHHGLDQSNDPVLVESLQPQVVVVNNSATKGAEPKSMEAIRTTKSVETVWQVHKNYQAKAGWNTADEYIANPASNEDSAQFIKASVERDGRFSVQLGTNGTKRSYKVR